MKGRAFYITVASIFTLVALVHGARLLFGWDAFISNVEVPMWVSLIAVIGGAYFAIRGFSLAKKKRFLWF